MRNGQEGPGGTIRGKSHRATLELSLIRASFSSTLGVMMSLVSVDLTDSMRPLSIEGDADHRVLIIAWSDGHMSPMGYEWLRWRCPCSSCAGQSGKRGVLSFTRELAPRRKNLVDIHLVGRYGIAPVWEDGHHAGVFSFRNLRAMCPCGECAGVAVRPAGAANGPLLSRMIEAASVGADSIPSIARVDLQSLKWRA